MRKSIILILLVLSAVTGQAQINTLDIARHWVSYENIDLYTGQTLTDTFQITLDKTALTLENAGHEIRFQIEDLAGHWPNIDQPGQVTFDILVKDFRGKGTVQQASGVISLTIDLSERKNWMFRKFIINP